MAENNRKGIISAGNWVADTVKFIDAFPQKGNLTTITGVEVGLGGLAHNVLVDLASMHSGLPLYAGGCIGADDNGRLCMEACDRFGIDRTNLHVLEGESTAYTDVMTERGGARTFFHYRGANAHLDVEKVLACQSPARIFHLGYLLLLDSLDQADPEYGVAAARALDGLQKMGYETSVDVVSEEGDRYRQVVLPCLKYTDYLIINEVEAENSLNCQLRASDGSIRFSDVEAAARRLLDLGVHKLVVIHFPEGGVAAAKDGRCCSAPSFSPAREEILSTVGAGDAFCAGALYAIHEGFSLEDLLDFASASARFNLFNPTSTGGAPTLEAIQAFLQSRKQQ
ncbi:MAG: carbohydrate kinase family protein [Bacteroidales bacterium]|nr:carbohydrate kinase family protein [Bacteroidales bacterium]